MCQTWTVRTITPCVFLTLSRMDLDAILNESPNFMEEFRKAIEATPDDWDTKFDFELATRLAAELRKQPNTPPKQMMQLLRPPTAGAKPPRRTG